MAPNMWSSLYALATAATTPASVAKICWDLCRGLESRETALQRLGLSTNGRGTGPLIWICAQSTAECAVALPVLFRCLLEYNEKVNILLTTGSRDAYALLKESLPNRVLVQLIPLDNPVCVALFLKRWRPQVGIIMESPMLPNLVLLASYFGVKLTLLNAHLSSESLTRWHMWRSLRTLMGNVLGCFTLIVPQSDLDVGRFRIFGTAMKQMPGWCSDLQYAAALGTSVWDHMWKPSQGAITELKQRFSGRVLWLAANTQAGEEEVVARVHLQLCDRTPGLCTVVVPRDSERCPQLANLFRGMGLSATLWSDPNHKLACTSDILLVDDPTVLPLLYAVAEVVVVGNSLVEGCGGHNLSDAAVAGCAILVGPHGGQALQMAEELNGAALVACEEAATAVRNTGQSMEEPAWSSSPQHAAEAHYGSPNDLNRQRGGIGSHVDNGHAMTPQHVANGSGVCMEPQTAMHHQQPHRLARWRETERPSTAPAAVVGPRSARGADSQQPADNVPLPLSAEAQRASYAPALGEHHSDAMVDIGSYDSRDGAGADIMSVHGSYSSTSSGMRHDRLYIRNLYCEEEQHYGEQYGSSPAASSELMGAPSEWGPSSPEAGPVLVTPFWRRPHMFGTPSNGNDRAVATAGTPSPGSSFNSRTLASPAAPASTPLGAGARRGGALQHHYAVHRYWRSLQEGEEGVGHTTTTVEIEVGSPSAHHHQLHHVEGAGAGASDHWCTSPSAGSCSGSSIAWGASASGSVRHGRSGGAADIWDQVFNSTTQSQLPWTPGRGSRASGPDSHQDASPHPQQHQQPHLHPRSRIAQLMAAASPAASGSPSAASSCASPAAGSGVNSPGRLRYVPTPRRPADEALLEPLRSSLTAPPGAAGGAYGGSAFSSPAASARHSGVMSLREASHLSITTARGPAPVDYTSASNHSVASSDACAAAPGAAGALDAAAGSGPVSPVSGSYAVGTLHSPGSMMSVASSGSSGAAGSALGRGAGGCMQRTTLSQWLVGSLPDSPSGEDQAGGSDPARRGAGDAAGAHWPQLHLPSRQRQMLLQTLEEGDSSVDGSVAGADEAAAAAVAAGVDGKQQQAAADPMPDLSRGSPHIDHDALLELCSEADSSDTHTGSVVIRQVPAEPAAAAAAAGSDDEAAGSSWLRRVSRGLSRGSSIQEREGAAAAAAASANPFTAMQQHINKSSPIKVPRSSWGSVAWEEPAAAAAAAAASAAAAAPAATATARSSSSSIQQQEQVASIKGGILAAQALAEAAADGVLSASFNNLAELGERARAATSASDSALLADATLRQAVAAIMQAGKAAVAAPAAAGSAAAKAPDAAGASSSTAAAPTADEDASADDDLAPRTRFRGSTSRPMEISCSGAVSSAAGSPPGAAGLQGAAAAAAAGKDTFDLPPAGSFEFGRMLTRVHSDSTESNSSPVKGGLSGSNRGSLSSLPRPRGSLGGIGTPVRGSVSSAAKASPVPAPAPEPTEGSGSSSSSPSKYMVYGSPTRLHRIPSINSMISEYSPRAEVLGKISMDVWGPEQQPSPQQQQHQRQQLHQAHQQQLQQCWEENDAAVALAEFDAGAISRAAGTATGAKTQTLPAGGSARSSSASAAHVNAAYASPGRIRSMDAWLQQQMAMAAQMRGLPLGPAAVAAAAATAVPGPSGAASQGLQQPAAGQQQGGLTDGLGVPVKLSVTTARSPRAGSCSSFGQSFSTAPPMGDLEETGLLSPRRGAQHPNYEFGPFAPAAPAAAAGSVPAAAAAADYLPPPRSTWSTWRDSCGSISAAAAAALAAAAPGGTAGSSPLPDVPDSVVPVPGSPAVKPLRTRRASAVAAFNGSGSAGSLGSFGAVPPSPATPRRASCTAVGSAVLGSGGLPMRLQGHAAAEMPRELDASSAAAIDIAGDGEGGSGSQPDTPTSRMSVVNAVTSPFANPQLDRPCPFRMSRGQIGSEGEARTARRLDSNHSSFGSAAGRREASGQPGLAPPAAAAAAPAPGQDDGEGSGSGTRPRLAHMRSYSQGSAPVPVASAPAAEAAVGSSASSIANSSSWASSLDRAAPPSPASPARNVRRSTSHVLSRAGVQHALQQQAAAASSALPPLAPRLPMLQAATDSPAASPRIVRRRHASLSALPVCPSSPFSNSTAQGGGVNAPATTAAEPAALVNAPQAAVDGACGPAVAVAADAARSTSLEEVEKRPTAVPGEVPPSPRKPASTPEMVQASRRLAQQARDQAQLAEAASAANAAASAAAGGSPTSHTPGAATGAAALLAAADAESAATGAALVGRLAALKGAAEVQGSPRSPYRRLFDSEGADAAAPVPALGTITGMPAFPAALLAIPAAAPAAGPASPARMPAAAAGRLASLHHEPTLNPSNLASLEASIAGMMLPGLPPVLLAPAAAAAAAAASPRALAAAAAAAGLPPPPASPVLPSPQAAAAAAAAAAASRAASPLPLPFSPTAAQAQTPEQLLQAIANAAASAAAAAAASAVYNLVTPALLQQLQASSRSSSRPCSPALAGAPLVPAAACVPLPGQQQEQQECEMNALLSRLQGLKPVKLPLKQRAASSLSNTSLPAGVSITTGSAAAGPSGSAAPLPPAAAPVAAAPARPPARCSEIQEGSLAQSECASPEPLARPAAPAAAGAAAGPPDQQQQQAVLSPRSIRQELEGLKAELQQLKLAAAPPSPMKQQQPSRREVAAGTPLRGAGGDSAAADVTAEPASPTRSTRSTCATPIGAPAAGADGTLTPGGTRRASRRLDDTWDERDVRRHGDSAAATALPARQRSADVSRRLSRDTCSDQRLTSAHDGVGGTGSRDGSRDGSGPSTSAGSGLLHGLLRQHLRSSINNASFCSNASDISTCLSTEDLLQPPELHCGWPRSPRASTSSSAGAAAIPPPSPRAAPLMPPPSPRKQQPRSGDFDPAPAGGSKTPGGRAAAAAAGQQQLHLQRPSSAPQAQTTAAGQQQQAPAAAAAPSADAPAVPRDQEGAKQLRPAQPAVGITAAGAAAGAAGSMEQSQAPRLPQAPAGTLPQPPAAGAAPKARPPAAAAPPQQQTRQHPQQHVPSTPARQQRAAGGAGGAHAGGGYGSGSPREGGDSPMLAIPAHRHGSSHRANQRQGTSYLRYAGEYVLPASQLPRGSQGPAVWRVGDADELAAAVGALLRDPLERRSRGHAAAQAAAKLASGLVNTVWHVLDDVAITPALHEYVQAQHRT